MVHPRGLILPQLPCGWVGLKEHKKNNYSYKKPKKYFVIEDIETGKKDKLTSTGIIEKYGLDIHQIYRGSNQKCIIKNKYKINSIPESYTNYIFTEIATGRKIKGTAREIQKELSYKSEASIYRLIHLNGNNRYKIKKVENK